MTSEARPTDHDNLPAPEGALFITRLDRDAWATIRGYVYQMALTVERWLNLQDGQILELERGEDIDVISTGLSANDLQMDRLLEQVKHREVNVTLRSAPALQALSSAIAHRASNASMSLTFRYTTNAQAGVEAESPFESGISAIAVWERLRTGELTDGEQDVAADGILTILRTCGKPNDLSAEAWQPLVDFVAAATTADLLDLVRSFEWGTGSGDRGEVEGRAKAWLLERGTADGSEGAQTIYEHLFAFVANRLTERGLKRLTTAERQTQVAMPFSTANQRSLPRVSALLRELDKRVEALEDLAFAHEDSLAQLHDQLGRIASAQGVAVTVVGEVSLPEIEMPALLTRGSRRRRSVADLVELASAHAWLALRGSMSTGKTELAKLVALEMARRTIWLRCRGLEPAYLAKVLRLLAASRAATSHTASGSRYAGLAEELSDGAVLVLDDLPRADANGDLLEELTMLSGACDAHGAHLVSTSAYPVPRSVRAELPASTLREIEVPWLSEAEVREVLESHGTPDSLLSREYVGFVAGVTHGHPLLVTAVVHNLERHNWVDDRDSFSSLISGEFAHEIDEEVTERLLNSVGDETTRDLLDRLSIAQRPLSLDDVDAVASVAPEIQRARERAHQLSGLWLQPDAGGGVSVSPLFTVQRGSNLAPATKRQCHAVFAQRFLEQPTLDQRDAQTALTHLLGAEQYDRAGVLYCRMLMQLERPEANGADYGWLSYWIGAPLPADMSLGVRILVRTFQISGRRKRDLDAQGLVAELGAFLDQAMEEEAWATLFALVHHPELGIGRLQRLLPIILEGRLPGGDRLVLPEQLEPAELIWFGGASVSAWHDELLWIETVRGVLASGCTLHDDGSLAEGAAMHLADWLWLAEARKSENERSWDTVLGRLEILQNAAREFGLDALWASAVRARMVVWAEYKGDLEAAYRLAQAGLRVPGSVTDRARFLIQECLGRQYIYAGRVDDGFVILEGAIAVATDAYPLQRVHALLAACAAAGSTQRGNPFQYAESAAALARSTDFIPDTEVVKALGELAISHWYADDLRSAFRALDEAAGLLLGSESDTLAWRDLYVVFGYVLAYIGSEGREAQAQMEGGAPQRGLFLTSSDNRAALYGTHRSRFLLDVLATFAEKVGECDRAEAWANRGIREIRDRSDALLTASYNRHLLGSLVRDGRYYDALASAVEVANVLTASMVAGSQGADALTAELDVESLLGVDGSPPREATLETAMSIGLVPAVFQLCELTLTKPIEAEAHARTVAEACRRISAACGGVGLWETAAALVEAGFLAKGGFASMSQKINSAPADASRMTQIICGLAATIQGDAMPSDALGVYVGGADVLASFASSCPCAWREFALPFIEKYWLGMVDRMPFQFSPAQLTREGIERSSTVPAARRLRAILQAVALGLRVHLPPAA